MAKQQYLVEKAFAYNDGNKVVQHNAVGEIVQLDDDAALQVGEAVKPLGHDGPKQAKTKADKNKAGGGGALNPDSGQLAQDQAV